MESEEKTNSDETKQGSTGPGEHDWKVRFNELVQSCQTELKRTTQIGMKMLSASQSNAELHDSYEELGRLAKSAMKSGSLQWEDEKAKELMDKILGLEEKLEGLEEDVKNIKNS